MFREIGFREGYSLMRDVGADRLTSAFIAFVWVLRGDLIWCDEK